ncbi:hypothetical protein GTR04_7593 [Trichophyton interdigitale]|nr:hypothetical protein GY631_7575 [Trichophyton interdigitale]KAG5216427.1 hypothetical protein GY632_7566 [Trichophyton interdigitale]KAG8205025.1 hypothetical protein GTR04_7593 [Trichophyton interdigitale]
MHDKFKKCSECTRRGRKCEQRLFSVGEWEKQHKDEASVARKLADSDTDISHFQRELEIAQGRVAMLQRYLSTVLNSHAQLRKSQQFVRDRGVQMLSHDAEVSKYLDASSPPSSGSSEFVEGLDPFFWDRLLSDSSLLGPDKS